MTEFTFRAAANERLVEVTYSEGASPDDPHLVEMRNDTLRVTDFWACCPCGVTLYPVRDIDVINAQSVAILPTDEVIRMFKIAVCERHAEQQKCSHLEPLLRGLIAERQAKFQALQAERALRLATQEYRRRGGPRTPGGSAS